MVAQADHAVAEAFRSKGYKVLTSGWPDLLVYNERTGAVMAVELKRGKDKLRPAQTEMLTVLRDLVKVPVFVARDEDIEQLLGKKGRVMLPNRTVRGLQDRVATLELELARALYELQSIARDVDNTTMLFEPERTPSPLAEIFSQENQYQLNASRMINGMKVPENSDTVAPAHGHWP